ncbi:MAG: hypothetical protein MUE78_01750 [Ilumatobacteraceae bacterium]|jgi:hypothetical protein|nr:hypothetical protein [Ilumatobacteraceae bacterium]
MARRLTLLLTIPLLAVAACGGDDGGSASTEDWCDLAREVESTFDEGDAVDFTDPAAVEEQFRSSVEVLQRAADAAPEEISDDVQTTVEAFEELVGLLEDADFDFLAIDQAAFEEIGVRAEEASANIEEFNETECGIPASGSSDESGSSDDTVADDSTGDDSTGDDSSGDDSTGDDSSSGTLPESGSIRDMLVQQFTAIGLTEEEATCIADKVDINDPAMTSGDPTAMLDLFEECGIDMARLAELGGG